MRKRSKIRISQDEVLWKRVTKQEEDALHLFSKKTTRWTSGASRDWNTALLNTQKNSSIFKALLQSFLKDCSISDKMSPWRFKLNQKFAYINKKHSKSKPKNFCLLLGKCRTYNRKIFISRQIFRKLLRTNALSGFQNG